MGASCPERAPGGSCWRRGPVRPGHLADQAGFTGLGYLVAMAVVVAVAAAILTWRVLRLRA